MATLKFDAGYLRQLTMFHEALVKLEANPTATEALVAASHEEWEKLIDAVLDEDQQDRFTELVMDMEYGKASPADVREIGLKYMQELLA